MPAQISDAFHAKFGFAPAEAYGLIEVGLPCLNTETRSGGRGTVGRVLPDYEVRLRAPDAEGIGEVLLRGKGMFDAYLSPWRLRSECLDDGWFSTGDLGRLDEAGRLCLLGRTKAVIISAGMKVFPEEVEAVINAIPGVSESLVFGEEHPQLGQVPIASVVLAPTVEGDAAFVAGLRRACCERLSPYMVPVEFRLVGSLPRTTSGKLARKRMLNDE
jgi:long-chain acyl-CoA synthetase